MQILMLQMIKLIIAMSITMIDIVIVNKIVWVLDLNSLYDIFVYIGCIVIVVITNLLGYWIVTRLL